MAIPNIWRVAALGGVLACQPIAAQIGNSVQVRVVDASGAPVPGARVCAGTAQNRGASGGGTTNAAGVATIALVQPETASSDRFVPVTPNPQITVTANVAGRGAQTIVGGVAMAMIQLPATATGPACPSTVATAPGVGIQVQRADVLAGLERSRASAPTIERPTFLAGRAERCFGAIGSGCGEGNVITAITGGPFAPSTCSSEGECTINAGSWKHDECCALNASGGLCDGKFEEILTGQAFPGKSADVCQAELNLGASRIPTLYNWKRRVDVNRVNTSRQVEHAAYCARPGSFMPVGEQQYCCSRQVRTPNPVETAMLIAHPMHTAFLSQARVCT